MEIVAPRRDNTEPYRLSAEGGDRAAQATEWVGAIQGAVTAAKTNKNKEQALHDAKDGFLAGTNPRRLDKALKRVTSLERTQEAEAELVSEPAPAPGPVTQLRVRFHIIRNARI